MRYLLLCLAVSMALPAHAQIYKYKDAAGNTVFGDQPPDGRPAEQVKLPPPNTVQTAPPASASQPSVQPETGAPQVPYSRLELTGLPDEGGALRANDGGFSVGVIMQPPLSPDHTLRLLLDNKPYAEVDTATGFTLNEIDRGEHRLALEVLMDGKPIQRSEDAVFTVQRVSVNSPARAAP